MKPGQHWYMYVLDRDGWRITTNVYSDQPLTGDELLPLAVELSIIHARALGVTALPDEYTPVGYRYRGIM